MLTLLSAMGGSMPPQMNPVKYTVANAIDPSAAFGFHSPDYFEVYSLPITSRYGGVVWHVFEPVPLPAAIVERYNGTVMAVTGFEVDVVRTDEGGVDHSVPSYESYNHHYSALLRGAGATLSTPVGTPNMRHVSFVRTPGGTTAQAGELPFVQRFNEHNGNEHRQSYHGLPQGFVQPIVSPVDFVFNPMQINTKNPDGSGTRGGPLPRSSAAPPHAAYSGILECPCTTRVVKNVSASTINGRPFHPSCTSDARRSDLLAHANPTCDVSTYVGGMQCCMDGDVLLDHDQPQPTPVDTVRFKWRFYHEAYDPAAHSPTVHLEWAVNGCDSGGPNGNPSNCAHIEYDAVASPPSTPPAEQVHTVTSHFRTRDMLAPKGCDATTDPYCADATVARARGGGVQLLMAGGHCHAPACLSLELWNDDTKELVCRVTPRLGHGDAVYDEAGYVYLPPCQWGHEPHLHPPPFLALDANLSAVKKTNSSVYHYGVMGIWQMRGAYMPAGRSFQRA